MAYYDDRLETTGIDPFVVEHTFPLDEVSSTTHPISVSPERPLYSINFAYVFPE